MTRSFPRHLVFLAAFLLAGASLFPEGVPAGHYLLVCYRAVLGLGLADIFVRVCLRRRRETALIKQAAGWIVLIGTLLAVNMAVATVWSQVSLRDWLYCVEPIVAFTAVALIASDQSQTRMPMAAALILAIGSSLAVWHLVSLSEMVTTVSTWGYLPKTPANPLAQLLALPIGMLLAFSGQSFWHRFVGWAMTAVIAVSLVTGIMRTYLLLVLATAFLLPFACWPLLTRAGRRNALLAIVGWILLAAVLIGVSPVAQRTFLTYSYYWSSLASDSDSSAYSRVLEMSEAFKAWAGAPIFGRGFGYTLRYASAYTADLEKQYVHALPLGFLLYTGLMGAVVWLSYVLHMVSLLWRRVFSKNDLKTERLAQLGLSVSFLLFLVESLFDSSGFSPLSWFYLGLLTVTVQGVALKRSVSHEMIPATADDDSARRPVNQHHALQPGPWRQD